MLQSCGAALVVALLLLFFIVAIAVDQALRPCDCGTASCANVSCEPPCGQQQQACLNRGFDALTAWLANEPVSGSITLTLVLTLCAMVLIPASALTVASGAAFARALGLATGVLVGSCVVFVGFSLGAVLAFVLARFLLHDLVQRQLHRWRITSAIDAALEEEGLKVMVLLRLSPLIPYNVLNYVIAASSVSLRDYTLSLAAMLPGVVAYVYLGGAVADAAASSSSGAEQTARVMQTVLLAVGALASVLALVAVSWFARRQLKQRISI